MKQILSFTATAALAAAVLLGTVHAAASKSNVGQQVPALKLDYVGKKPEKVEGQPMILEFWATWCPPCRTSIPHLNEVYKKYKDKGLVVIGVTDEDNQTVRRFEKQVPMEYFPATDRNGKLNKEFGIQGIPHAMLVDKSGKIVWEGHPMSLKDADVEKILE
jgi:thiol-disulfide isomerase/thioredoxin